jgi:MFS family permease
VSTLPDDSLSASAATLEAPLPADYARNARAIAGEAAVTGFAMSFFSTTTVLPAYVATLTRSEVMVGLVVGLVSAAWLLPQLAIVSLTARVVHKRRLMMAALWANRPVYLALSLATLLLAARQPALALALLIVGLLLHAVGDATATTAWFDLLGRLIPPQRRGRVLGGAQVLGGLTGIGAGIVVRYVLSPRFPWGYPANYATLLAITGVCLLGGTGLLSRLREPPPSPERQAAPSVRQVLASLPRILLGDRPFRRALIVRLLGACAGLANAFYVLYATRHLGLSAETTGYFVSAQVAGLLASGLLTPPVQDRLGPLAHMRLTVGLAALPAGLALLLGALAPTLGPRILYPYLLVYFFLGLYGSFLNWPFFNWILEYAPEPRRAVYIGLFNTLAAVGALAPTLGGWVVRTFSYPAAFVLSAACALGALLLALKLPNPRQPE